MSAGAVIPVDGGVATDRGDEPWAARSRRPERGGRLADL